jgi:hypothetical protein
VAINFKGNFGGELALEEAGPWFFPNGKVIKLYTLHIQHKMNLKNKIKG